MRKTIFHLIVTGAFLTPVVGVAQERDRQEHREQVRRYEDRAHHDSHEWNEREDQAYRRYLEEHHRPYRNFELAKQREQNQYWTWRHNHPDHD